jgi:hypothetical protein
LCYEALPCTDDLPSKVLMLDATADPDIHRGYFRRVPGVVGDEDFEMDFDVTQLVDGQYHLGTIKGNDDYEGAAKRLQQVIDHDSAKYDSVLLVGHKKAKYLYDIPDNAEYIHYQGGTRALNREQFEHVLILGANHPPYDALRRQAFLLSLEVEDLSDGGAEHSTRPPKDENDEVLPPDPVKYIFVDDEGNGRQVRTKYYTGLTGTLFEQRREKETEQAVHRIRPLLNAGKSATLCTNVPTRLPVTRFDTIRDYTRQRAHHRLLDHFEEEFSVAKAAAEFDVSESTARRWISKCEDEGLVCEIGTSGGVTQYYYDVA